ncbi:MAG: hypothetical protein HY738_15330 [Bacteroidia bacterium]|nr:hypothetical protein [Bacteroidia bacterium]
MHKKNDIISCKIEDIDLLIAYCNNEKTYIILIEAKYTSQWHNKQLQSKVKRLKKIFGIDGKKYKNIYPYFILTSPKKPTKLSPEISQNWHENNNKINWFCFRSNKKIQRIVSCNQLGISEKSGLYWKIRNTEY